MAVLTPSEHHAGPMTPDIRRITAEETRPIRREVLKPGLPEAAVHLPGDEGPGTIHLGAFDGDVLIGIATFFADPAPVDGGATDWRLRGMATLPSVRNRGIGGALLEAGVDWAQEAGATTLWCNGRTRARAFYERHGFTVVGDEFDLPHSGPHFVFIRPLT
jgi:GNAT superfamily N-acetyltransferase